MVPWQCVIGFLRISTSPRFYPRPTSAESSLSFLHAVLTAPVVINGEPDQRHLDRVATLLAATGTGGNLVNDAHLGALALQYDATVVSFDNDFSRFPGVRWEQPQAISGN
jgi:toxin-antitoxin system PIN domain toxin